MNGWMKSLMYEQVHRCFKMDIRTRGQILEDALMDG